MAKKLSKKQRSALRNIDGLSAKRKREIILGIASIVAMIVIIQAYNTLAYGMEVIDATNAPLRAAIYIIAIVVAAYSGIMFMYASRNQRKIDRLRQDTGISRETLDMWKRGEFEE